MDYFLILLLLFLEPSCMEHIPRDNVTTTALPSTSSSSTTTTPFTYTSTPPHSPPTTIPPSLIHAESALLHHIHDAHSHANVLSLRHTHHNHHFGPHFEENEVTYHVEELMDVTLNCKVGLIEDKLVSWVRARRKSAQQLDLLTLGLGNHSSDTRIFSNFKYPNNWALTIKNSSRNDSGLYKCTISTHPPKILEILLTVEAPEVFIVNSRHERILDVYYKEGSTLKLICIVNNIKSKIVNWYKNKEFLNHDLTRGGISIKTDMTKSQAKSILNVLKVTKKDSGTFTCTAPPFKNASVSVHVLSAGENPAELYHNNGERISTLFSSWVLCGLIMVFSILYPVPDFLPTFSSHLLTISINIQHL